MSQEESDRRTQPEANPTDMTFPLVGPAGEKIDLWRTLVSHGMTSLPPMSIDEDARTLEVTLAIDGRRPRTVRIGSGKTGLGSIHVLGRSQGRHTKMQLMKRVRHILRLDDDLSEFYTTATKDPEMSWVANGAGRMIQGATVFEDVIKTICTTNCAWSATERMVGALCEHLGEAAFGVTGSGPYGRAFPSAESMAEADESFYQNVVRAGYRGRYLRAIARSVAEGPLDLERFGRESVQELPDEELERQLLELPGVGPYAAAHIMLTIGRYSRLIFDSWTRPKYARLVGKSSVEDATIERRFRRYGRFAGLAFWMFLTRDWVDDPEATTS
jgi:3-methyladenine DNA glycosylase/8-oxoguanine DNA glycosylase